LTKISPPALVCTNSMKLRISGVTFFPVTKPQALDAKNTGHYLDRF
jgi:hypothetical protein